MTALATYPRPSMTDDSEVWLQRLRGPDAERDAAVADLHALLLRAAHHELSRRQVAGLERDDLAVQAAGDALVAVLAKLDTFRGASRFTTWAYKFALLEAGVKTRRRAWQDREVALDTDAWSRIADRGDTPDQDAETRELLGAIGTAIERALTPHQRRVLVAITLDDVPIDVLAERLGSTRGAVYKTLHDARRKLRADLTAGGHAR
jgi:RNA polymerase sigma-70 factor, ECF subfamily